MGDMVEMERGEVTLGYLSRGVLVPHHPKESAADPYKLSLALSVAWPPQSLLIFRYWDVSCW